MPVPGQPASLRCAAQGVYPRKGLRLTWYWGNKMLEEKDLDVTETDEELFDIVSTLPVAGEEVGEGVAFRCEVTLSIGQETFTRVASVVASAGGECRGGSWGPGSLAASAAAAVPHRPALPVTASLGWQRPPFLHRAANLSPSPLLCQRCPFAPARCPRRLVRGMEEDGAIGLWGWKGLSAPGDNLCQRGPVPAPSRGEAIVTRCVHSCDRAAGGHGHLHGKTPDSSSYNGEPQHSRARDHHSPTPRAKSPHTRPLHSADHPTVGARR